MEKRQSDLNWPLVPKKWGVTQKTFSRKFDEAFITALSKYAQEQSALSHRRIGQSLILQTVALLKLPRLQQLYREEISKASAAGK